METSVAWPHNSAIDRTRRAAELLDDAVTAYRNRGHTREHALRLAAAELGLNFRRPGPCCTASRSPCSTRSWPASARRFCGCWRPRPAIWRRVLRRRGRGYGACATVSREMVGSLLPVAVGAVSERRRQMGAALSGGACGASTASLAAQPRPTVMSPRIYGVSCVTDDLFWRLTLLAGTLSFRHVNQ